MKPIRCVLFDLDGTLLPMDLDEFIKGYFGALTKSLIPHGYGAEEFLGAMWRGVRAMLKNNGEKTNEERFWEELRGVFGDRIERDLPLFEAFYENEFPKFSSHCGFDPMAATAVRSLKEKGYAVALATQPVFPRIATENRVRWAGLSFEEFAHVTTYENSAFCKPSEQYFRSVAETLGFDPEECLMVGNDTADDMPAARVGMRVFLLTPCLINKSGEDINRYPHGDFTDLMAYVEKGVRAAF